LPSMFELVDVLGHPVDHHDTHLLLRASLKI